MSIRVPARDITVAQQRAYDHLRLVESAIKSIPEHVIERCDQWLALLEHKLDCATRAADLRPLLPALGRVASHPTLSRRLPSVFSGWSGTH
ncbi:MAG: hypothetical protein GKR94_01195 [Gammaproteobacteria bacterium]|nr:hypothetical protein [Gammaproteobacteria bacterium]